MNKLATKQQTEPEILDEIDWLVHDYAKAMKVHDVKASQNLLDVLVIAPLELLEDLVKFRWSKIAKGTLSVKKREVDLMEAEMKASGRECAYVFDARERLDLRR